MAKNKALNYVQSNKAVTTLDEVIANVPEATAQELKHPDVLKALEQNRVMMKLMLKTKLFKNDTTQSIIELNRIIDNESNSKKVSDFIDNIAKEWKSNGN